MALIAALRSVLPAPTYLVTCALPAGEWALRNIPLAQAAQNLSYINLMTYDFAGPWTQACGYHSQLFSPKKPHNDDARISCESATNYVIAQGVPAEKVLLGIPAYGRSFLGAKKPGDAYHGGGGEEGTFEYRDLARPAAKEGFDKDVVAAYCVDADGGIVIYQDQQCVQRKANFVKQRGVGGLFYWTGTGDTNDDRSLVMTGSNGLRG